MKDKQTLWKPLRLLAFAIGFATLALMQLSAQQETSGGEEKMTEVNDPLHKPQIWERLKSRPTDARLWNEYFGKDWTLMTNDENARLRKWKIYLIQKKRATEMANEEKVFENYMEKERLKEALTVEYLKHNIVQNFVFIEDYYKKEFPRLGSSYISYSEQYPNEDFSLVLWVETHDEKLKKLRAKK